MISRTKIEKAHRRKTTAAGLDPDLLSFQVATIQLKQRYLRRTRESDI